MCRIHSIDFLESARLTEEALISPDKSGPLLVACHVGTLQGMAKIVIFVDQDQQVTHLVSQSLCYFQVQ